MIAAAQRAGVTLMVGPRPAVLARVRLRLQRLAESGELGALRALTCHRLVTRPGPYAPWLLDPAQGPRARGGRDPRPRHRHGAPRAAGRGRRIRGPRRGGLVAPPGPACGYDGRRCRDGRGRLGHARGGAVQRGLPRLLRARGRRVRLATAPDAADRPRRRDRGGRVAGGETEGGPWAFDATPLRPRGRGLRPLRRRGSAPGACPPEDARQAVELTLAALEAAATGREVGLDGLYSPASDRQGDPRRPRAVVEHGLRRDDRLLGPLVPERAARVQVAVPVREVGARDVEAEAIAGRDPDADRAERDPVLVDPAGLDRRRAGRASRRKRARMIPSLRFTRLAVRVDPAELAVKSVSTAVDAACSVTMTSPTRSRSCSSGAGGVDERVAPALRPVLRARAPSA